MIPMADNHWPKVPEIFSKRLSFDSVCPLVKIAFHYLLFNGHLQEHFILIVLDHINRMVE